MKNLYIISEQDSVVEALKPMGQHSGFDVRIADSVDDATLQFIEHEPAVIIVDQDLPQSIEVQLFTKLCSMEYCTAPLWVDKHAQASDENTHRRTNHFSIATIEKRIQELRTTLFELSQSDFHQAIENDELKLYCQPSVCMKTQQIIGAEILLRWQHPKYGLIAPGQFFARAETFGMLDQLYNWVIHSFFQHFSSWNSRKTDLKFGLNIGETLLMDPSFELKMNQYCEKNGLSNQYVMLDIDEPVAINPKCQSVIQNLANSGWQLVLDRFELSAMSLAQLYTTPFHYVKLHPKFITNLGLASNAETITQQLLDIAKACKLQTIAVGIEKATAWHSVSSLGCDFAQGYYISHPIPFDTFKSWFTGSQT